MFSVADVPCGMGRIHWRQFPALHSYHFHPMFDRFRFCPYYYWEFWSSFALKKTQSDKTYTWHYIIVRDTTVYPTLTSLNHLTFILRPATRDHRLTKDCSLMCWGCPCGCQESRKRLDPCQGSRAYHDHGMLGCVQTQSLSAQLWPKCTLHFMRTDMFCWVLL